MNIVENKQLFIAQATALVSGEDNLVTNLSNLSALYKEYLPKMFPLVHPSPLNRRWMAKNPWFEEDVLPEFKKRVQEIIKGAK